MSAFGSILRISLIAIGRSLDDVTLVEVCRHDGRQKANTGHQTADHAPGLLHSPTGASSLATKTSPFGDSHKSSSLNPTHKKAH